VSPATRKASSREAKRNEILEAAERQLLAGGYNRLSVAAIARDLGVAANTIYWYFPTKDHLFVAVLERMTARLLRQKPPHSAGLVQQALWFAARMAELQPVRIAVHERARTSALVADFERHYRAGMAEMLAGGLRENLPDAEVEVATRAFVATVEGVLVLGLSPKQRDAVLARVLQALIANPRGRS
jgi:AcrR family transcriptional regulator